MYTFFECLFRGVVTALGFALTLGALYLAYFYPMTIGFIGLAVANLSGVVWYSYTKQTLYEKK